MDPLNAPMNDLTHWLDSIGLAEHAPAFIAQGVDFELLPQLSDADLKELGVALLGHRKRLLLALAALASTASAAAAGSSSNIGPLSPREAERRQLTVMFCDLVGSTALSARLDPEDLQRVLRAFHGAVTAAVTPYEGHMAQLLGDGCLVYFGYPRAHEDDAARAVRAALSVLRAVAALRPDGAGALQTRIGIATGIVVVGEMGAGTAAVEQTASGGTPNLAARLQAQAAPGQIVLSDETRLLLGASFELEATGALDVKGFAAPVQAWRVRGERSVASRFEAQHDTELGDFVGRASEVALLLERWGLVRDGEGQAVLLSGEAGIGKSRICQTLRDRLATEPHAAVLLQCSPYHRNSAMFPLVQYFERLTGIVPADSPEQRGQKLEQLSLPEVALSPAALGRFLRLMGAPDGGRLPADLNPQQDKALMLQAPVDLLHALARQVPVLLLIEDAHWIDPTTEELAALTIEQSRDSRLLLLVTCRPEYMPPWRNPTNLTRLALNRFGQRQTAELISSVTGGKSLPDEVLTEIIRKTDGIPLFVEELTKTVLQSGLLDATPGGYRLRGPLPPLAIPSTLQDSLMARLDNLAPAKEVAQVGAMIGREFSRRLLDAVLRLPAPKLADALDDLVRSELVHRRHDGTDELFTFRHALIRDTASNSLLKGQRVLRHGQIAAAMEALEPERAAAQPELLAHHWQEAGQHDAARRNWTAAGDRASARAANREAAAHYRVALELVPTMADPQARDAAELALQIKLGNLLMATEGFAFAPTVACFSRARELARQLGQIDTYARACAGIGASLWSQGKFEEATQLLGSIPDDDLARMNPMSRVSYSIVLALVKAHLGDLEAAHRLSLEALRDLDRVPPDKREDISGVDPGVMALSNAVSVCVPMGLLDQAEAYTNQLIQIARGRDHGPTQSWALSNERWLAYRKGDIAESLRISQQQLELLERLELRNRFGPGRLLLGRSVVASGRVDEGALLLREGFDQFVIERGVAGTTEMAVIAAEVLIECGRFDDAQTYITAGEKTLSAVGERNFAAELARLRARLVYASGAPAKAEAIYREAITIAEGQGAVMFQLRAAHDLARLLQGQARSAEARAVLQPAVAALTEGFGYPEVQRAQATLASLGV